MTLEELRKQIDEIDDRLAKDFTDRMRVCEEIAAAKRETGKPIADPARERQKLDDIAGSVGLRPETVSRYIRRMVNDGLIEKVGQSGIRITDFAAMQLLVNS